MQCGCIKNIFDVYVGASGCKQLIYEDASLWMEDTGYEIPETYKVTVTTPSGNTKDLELEVGCRNIITTVDLFSSKEVSCLEDGIYCFETESCGVKYKTSRAFLCNIECTVDKIIADADFQDDLEEVRRYKVLLDSVKINTEQGNTETAMKVLDYLKRELDRFENCGECG